MQSLLRSVLAGLAIASVGAACGGTGRSRSASTSQTLDITMRDISFSPDRVTVPAGRVVQFVFHNTGKVAHEAFMGDDQAQMDHEMAMGSSMAGMAHGEDAITVEPGRTATLTRTFGAADRLLIGCHEKGHYAAGMKIMVMVR